MCHGYLVDRNAIQSFRLEYDAGIRLVDTAQQETLRVHRSARDDDLKRERRMSSFKNTVSLVIFLIIDDSSTALKQAIDRLQVTSQAILRRSSRNRDVR